MGTGSSRRRGPGRRQEGHGAMVGPAISPNGSTPSPTGPERAQAAPTPSPDPDLELLAQALEEYGDGKDNDGEGGLLENLRLSPGRHFLPPPPPPPPLRLDAGDLKWRLPQDGVGLAACSGAEKKQELPQKAARSISESSNFANQVPPKDPDKLAKIAYDYSEEELMATIEQEYCR